MDLHRLAEERSIAYHRAIAARLREEPGLLERARARVDEWLARGEQHAACATEWARILRLPLAEMAAALVAPSEAARALRQVTPFAGAIPARDRGAIARSVARTHGRA